MNEQQTASEALPRGLILGNCVVVQNLAHCKSGDTYLVRDIDDGSVYVVKENCVYSHALCDETRDIRAPRQGAATRADRTTGHFYNEAQLLSSLDHPNIVKAVRVFPAGDTAYFAMPFMDGLLLGNWLRQHGRPDPETLYTLQRSMLSALDYLHRRNLLHGSVDPFNIFMPEIGEPLLLGFAEACYIGEEEGAAGDAGTPRLSHGGAGPQEDLVSLGGTLYCALTGNFPKTCRGHEAHGEELRRLSEDADFVKVYGKPLLEAIDRAQDKEPEKRWKDASEWLLALDAVDHKTVGRAKEKAAQGLEAPHGRSVAELDAPDMKAKRYGSVIVIMVLVILSAITYMLSLQKGNEAAAALDSGRKQQVELDKAAPAHAAAVEKPQMSEAVAESLKQAESGSADAQVSAAMFYSLGLGVGQNSAEAVRWAYRAAAQGKTEAHAMLGKFYLNGFGVEQNYAEAIKWYRKAAEKGHVESQCRLGILCACGHGAVKDGPEGLKWLRKAAGQGHTEAEYLAGLCYTGGHSVKRDIEEGRMWFRKAATQGAARSFLFCGVCEGMCGNTEEAGRWLELSVAAGSVAARKLLEIRDSLADAEKCKEALQPYIDAAEKGDAEALCLMGVCHSVGLGVKPSLDEAVKAYVKGAAGGCAEARDNLALFYIFGRSVDLDFKSAAKLFAQAAEQGYSPAQCSYGSCFMMGRGVERDSAKAFKWYLTAAEQGLSDAQCNVGTCYVMGLGVEPDPVKAVEFYRRSAEQGLVDAQYYLGGCYLEGLGVPQNTAEAVKWYRKAALQGNTEAEQIADSLESVPF